MNYAVSLIHSSQECGFQVMAVLRLGVLSALAIVCLSGCETAGDETVEKTGPVEVARFDGGTITEEDLQRELQRMPPHLRERFDSPVGRREFARSLVDKRLLAQEAARRGFTQDGEIRRQVIELEERLSIQAMLAQEERAAAKPTDAEVRAFYEANRERFAEPERLRVGRVLAQVPAGSAPGTWAQARARAESFRKRLRAGEALEKVASAGDGPERTRGGELGLLTRGEFGSLQVEEAAVKLTRQGEVSPVVQEPGGFSVLVLVERRAARVPAFEEVRSAVLGKMAPTLQRRVFEQVLARLREGADVKIEPVESERPAVAQQ